MQHRSPARPLSAYSPRLLAVSAACLCVVLAARADTHYVSLSGAHQSPFTTWADAATNVQDALNAASEGDMVAITNGTYMLSSQLSLNAGITVVSVNGASETVVNANHTGRCFYLGHPNAVLNGLTITGGEGQHGSGVYCAGGGTVTNCVLAGNSVGGDFYGGAVYCNGGGAVIDCTLSNNTAVLGSAVYCLYDGLVRGCLISNNTVTAGGTVYCDQGGLVCDCVIVDNDAGHNGGGVCGQYGGTIRNCLIAGNWSGADGGGVYNHDGGSIESCTIAGNGCSGNAGGVWWGGAGLIRNTIIYANQAGGSGQDFYNSGSGMSYVHCCSSADPGGTGNIDADPLFADFAGGDFQLSAGSPCIQSGTNDDWMAAAADLAGNPRIVADTVDIGAFEHPGAPLFCSFTGDPLTGPAPLNVLFTGQVQGTNTTELYYGWDFNGDSVYDAEGAELAQTSNMYLEAGTYTVSLTVSNAAGDLAAVTNQSYVHVAPSFTYVSLAGTHSFPYTNWTDAATNIQDAIDVAAGGTTVLVGDGTYEISSQVTVSDGVTVRGANGAEAAVVDGNGATRCFLLRHADAVLDGLTITGGRIADEGAGVYCDGAGTITNCILSANACEGDNYGGAVYCNGGGTVVDCTVSNNSAVLGAAVYCMSNALVQSCFISNNTCTAGGNVYCDRGGLVYGCTIVDNAAGHNGGGVCGQFGGVVRNCLIAGNWSGADGGGVYNHDGGSIESCTIVDNGCSGNGGGLWWGSAGLIQNTIIYSNQAGGSGQDFCNSGSGMSYVHCSSSADPGGTGNIAADPGFLDPAAYDFRLPMGSPCVDSGTNDSWMGEAADLAGHARIANGTVDIGAYEHAEGAMTCRFSGAPRTGPAPLNVIFTAQVEGTNTTGLYCGWDFDGDSVLDAEGPGLTLTSNTYDQCGSYTVSLSVSNSAGEVSAVTNEAYVRVGPVSTYVSLAGGHNYPYGSWTDAATNIQAAVDAATDGATVYVTNGTYVLSSQISVNSAVTILGVSGPEQTVVDGNLSTRCFFLGHTNAVLEGLTVTGGRGQHGSGVYCDGGGTVQDCILTGNSVGGDYYGGAVYCNGGGAVVDCTLSNNTAMLGSAVYCLYDGLVQGCLISNNTCNAGGNVYCDRGGLVYGCAILDNSAGHNGGGVCGQFGGTVRNCLIAGNSSGNDGGGVYNHDGGSIESCTIARNTCADDGGGVWWGGEGLIQNTIICSNAAGGTGTEFYNSRSGMSYVHCCSTTNVTGTANIVSDPGFRDAAAGDFRLLADSVCVDSGTNDAWMAGAEDLAGNTRIVNQSVDIGAYEYTEETLSCALTASPQAGLAPLAVIFTGWAGGANTTGLYCWWDFNGDGVHDAQGAGLLQTSNTYEQCGTYTVSLTVSNAAGEVAAVTNQACVRVATTAMYVSPAGGHAYPYANWADAATNIQAAVDAATDGTTVFVTNGTYAISAQIEVNAAVTITGVSGPDITIVDAGGSSRCFLLSHFNAVLDGLTITGGHSQHGSGVYCDGGGTIQNCILTGNSVTGDYYGGAVYCNEGGAVTDCVLSNNTAVLGSAVYCHLDGLVQGCFVSNNTCTAGGTVYCSYGGLVDSCTIVDNTTGHNGAGVCGQFGGTVRNCLIAGNWSGADGGGVYNHDGGSIESCTIADNGCSGKGGGVWWAGQGLIENTIICSNSANSSGPDFYNGAAGMSYVHCCSSTDPGGTGNITADPGFYDAASGDFRLAPGSACIDAGANEAWMATTNDLAGNARLAGGTVDIGAYEHAATTLQCSFTAAPRTGLPSLQVIFTGQAVGTNTTGLYCWWDFDGDAVHDAQGAGLTQTSNTYEQCGTYTVSLTVSNAAGEVAAATNQAYVLVAPAATYVSPTGGHSYPYANWADAATNIQAAVDAGADGTTVFVTNGTYALSDQVTVNAGVTITGVGGPENTTVVGDGSTRCVLLNHTNAMLAGFTITGGQGQHGSGVYCSGGGTVTNCVLRGNHVNGDYYGGAVYCAAGGAVVDCLIWSNDAVLGSAVYCLTNGLIQGCIISNNTCSAGGTVYCDRGGQVYDCLIVENATGHNGGGVCGQYGGAVRNCLIAGNWSGADGGGVYNHDGGSIESCTIADNGCDGNGGGIWWAGEGLILNTIIYSNAANGGGPEFYNSSTGMSYVHCCSSEDPGGTGNVAGNPGFCDAASGDFRLTQGSPCIDAGTNDAWMADANDLDGNIRVVNETVDIGAYERVEDALLCNFTGTPRTGRIPLQVLFTAQVGGTNTTGLYCWWDFDGDGIPDAQGAGLTQTSNTYVQSGAYDVSLAVSNAAGDSAAVTNQAYVCIAPTAAYVSLAGLHTYPYTNWTHAATNIQAAVDAGADGTTVFIASGTYPLSAQIGVGAAVTLVGVGGPGNTIIDGQGSTRCFLVSHPNAVLDGLTITGGQGQHGAGVYCNGGGIVTNCVLTGNSVGGEYNGGGVYCSGGGTVVDCVLSNNAAVLGSAVYCDEGGLVQGCFVSSNTCTGSGTVYCDYGGEVRNCTMVDNVAGQHGGAVCGQFGGRLVNCIIARNTAGEDGGGVYNHDGGSIESCTIVGNGCSGNGGGIRWAGPGAIRNTIIYANTAGGSGQQIYTADTAMNFTHCCTFPPVAGQNNIAADPKLTPDYRLRRMSSCIDTGTELNAPLTDIDGEGRWDHPDHANVTSIVDIGADEFVDADGDKMPDHWENLQFGSTTNRHAWTDGDGDGLYDCEEYDAGTDPANGDTDGDGMPDMWEVAYSLNPLLADASDDLDWDGFDNAAEYTASTSPWDDDSLFLIDRIGSAGSKAALSWASVNGRIYSVLRSTNLVGGFSLIASNLTATPPMNVYTDQVESAGAAYYEIRVELE
ncbi:MAG: PKD domain-containing protein [Kiritimatiellae bacterium]|nr:PKD domain-containing protein [Kiritimatiellia bacterium]